MGYYQTNARKAANSVRESISEIDEICDLISGIADQLSGDKNNFVDEYFESYEDIITNLKNTKSALDRYANNVVDAGIKVEREVEEEERLAGQAMRRMEK